MLRQRELNSRKLESDRMSLALGICIGITRDVMKTMDQGKSLKEMRVQIEKTYSKYGPSAHACRSIVSEDKDE